MPDTIVKAYAVNELIERHREEYDKLYKKYLKDKVKLRALEYEKRSKIMKTVLK